MDFKTSPYHAAPILSVFLCLCCVCLFAQSVIYCPGTFVIALGFSVPNSNHEKGKGIRSVRCRCSLPFLPAPAGLATCMAV